MSQSHLLNPADLREGTRTASSGRRRTRDSRRNDTRTVTIRIEHAPTGLVVQGEIPQGHYSRAELKILVGKMRVTLLDQLARMVTAHIKRERKRRAP